MTNGISDDIWQAIREMGPGAEPAINKTTKALFAPLIEHGDGIEQSYDHAYGDHPRQKLDIYRTQDLAGAPVVLYVPGGGFTGGDKRQDETFFGNVGRFFAKRGVVGVTMNYRLAPESTWPSAAQDIQSAVRWIKANINSFGGDPGRLVLFGHSAGAAHAGSYLFDPDINGASEVRAGALASGLYVLRTSEMRPNVAQYFGDDAATFTRRSAVSHVAGTKIPVFLSVAEFDPVALSTPTFELAAAITRRDGHPPPIMRVDGHNHFSYISSIGSPDERFSARLLDFVRKHTV
jgi:acetyl esterase/lipase